MDARVIKLNKKLFLAPSHFTLRKATLLDVKKIHALLQEYAKKGDLLARPLTLLYERVREFFVFEEEDKIIGCAALSIVWEDMAEIRSLAVAEEYQKQKLGKKLVEVCINEAKNLKIKTLFTLTYRPGFFQKLGFHEIDKKQLPHKIWSDCIHCPQFPDCNETALILNIS